MNIVFNINHPAQVHQFARLIKKLNNHGHNTLVLIAKKDNNDYLLNQYGIEYETIAKDTGKNLLDKIILLILTTFRMYQHILNFNPDYFIGRASPMLAINSFLFNKPFFMYTDTEGAILPASVGRLFAAKIITPNSYKKNLGKKHLRLDTYKELSYLHPKYFKKNKNIIKKYELELNKPIYLIRTVAWQAHHDVGESGINKSSINKLIQYLSAKDQLILSKEKQKPYVYKDKQTINFEDMHQIIAHSDLFITEGFTMAAEAAILGTPTIVCNSQQAGYIDELHNKYKLINVVNDGKLIMKKTEDIINNITNYKKKLNKRRNKMLSEKKDINNLLFNLIK